MDAITVGDAAARTGWSARMLRYLETVGLVVPTRTEAGYRVYGEAELEQLRDLRLLRERFELELDGGAFRIAVRRRGFCMLLVCRVACVDRCAKAAGARRPGQLCRATRATPGYLVIPA